MTNLVDVIKDFVAGDNLEIRRTITNIPAGQTLTKAWLTVKTRESDLDPGILQKAVTPTDVPGTGQITDTGADTIGEVRFDLVPADTALLVPTSIRAPFLFDIQVQTSTGNLYTPVKGTIYAVSQVTRAIS